jgi:hypothetical protein
MPTHFYVILLLGSWRTIDKENKFFFITQAQNAGDPTDVVTLNLIRPSIPKDFFKVSRKSHNGMIFLSNLQKKITLEGRCNGAAARRSIDRSSCSVFSLFVW